MTNDRVMILIISLLWHKSVVGDPSGIRTRDLCPEKAASWIARRWGFVYMLAQHGTIPIKANKYYKYLQSVFYR